MIYHNHHKIPKHAGGSDDPSNIIRLTVEEHAEAHRLLYEQYGRWQDYVAFKALEGTAPKTELIKMIQSFATKGKKQSIEHIQKRKMFGEKNPMYGKFGELNPMYGKKGELSPNFGKKHSKETKEKISKNHKQKGIKPPSQKGIPKSEEHKNKLSKPKPKLVCRLKDRKEMSLSNFSNWVRMEENGGKRRN
jgi:hypothetical protein